MPLIPLHCLPIPVTPGTCLATELRVEFKGWRGSTPWSHLGHVEGPRLRVTPWSYQRWALRVFHMMPRSQIQLRGCPRLLSSSGRTLIDDGVRWGVTKDKKRSVVEVASVGTTQRRDRKRQEDVRKRAILKSQDVDEKMYKPRSNSHARPHSEGSLSLS
jgi:hypothetical protein